MIIENLNTDVFHSHLKHHTFYRYIAQVFDYNFILNADIFLNIYYIVARFLDVDKFVQYHMHKLLNFIDVFVIILVPLFL